MLSYSAHFSAWVDVADAVAASRQRRVKCELLKRYWFGLDDDSLPVAARLLAGHIGVRVAILEAVQQLLPAARACAVLS